MTAKEYLNQAYRLDVKIRLELEQLRELNAVSAIAARPLSDMPKAPNRNLHSQEDLVCRILNMETEINARLEALISLKAEIRRTVDAVEDEDCRLVLIMRYLCFYSWERIAAELGYSVRTALRVHKKALGMVKNDGKIF